MVLRYRLWLIVVVVGGGGVFLALVVVLVLVLVLAVVVGVVVCVLFAHVVVVVPDICHYAFWFLLFVRIVVVIARLNEKQKQITINKQLLSLSSLSLTPLSTSESTRKLLQQQ